LQAGEEMQMPMPLTSLVQDMLVTLMAEGEGELDHSAIVHYLEKQAGVELGIPQTVAQGS
jgi:2-hydroxy-3-oxopropionate reductase